MSYVMELLLLPHDGLMTRVVTRECSEPVVRNASGQAWY
jgi:hypothetical protein